MNSVNSVKELILDLEFTKNELIIKLFFEKIKNNDILELIEIKIIEETIKQHKSNVDELTNILCNMSESILCLKKSIINEVKNLKINNNDNEKIKELKDSNLYEYFINEIKNVFKIYKKEVPEYQYMNLYDYYLKHKDYKKKIVSSSFIKKKDEPLQISCSKKIENKHNSDCCKSININKYIKYFHNCDGTKKLSVVKERETYGCFINKQKSIDDCFKGFFKEDHTFYKGIYRKSRTNSTCKSCKKCNSIEINGDLHYDIEKQEYLPNGYCIVKHYNKKNEIIDTEIGEFIDGVFMGHYGDINNGCSICKKNANIICLKCGYLCLKCDKDIHLNKMEKKKMLKENHKRSFYDNNIYVLYESRYLVGMREIIEKINDNYFKIKFNNQTKKLEEKKYNYNVTKLYCLKDIEYKYCDKVIDLLNIETNYFNSSFNEIETIINEPIFKIQMDMINDSL